MSCQHYYYYYIIILLYKLHSCMPQYIEAYVMLDVSELASGVIYYNTGCIEP